MFFIPLLGAHVCFYVLFLAEMFCSFKISTKTWRE